MKKQKRASRSEIVEWLADGIFHVENGVVWKGDRELKQRMNPRRNRSVSDARVDLCHDGKKASVNVSHLVWMFSSKRVVPDGFEIHHIDEDPTNNCIENLACVYSVDHPKLHGKYVTYEEAPF